MKIRSAITKTFTPILLLSIFSYFALSIFIPETQVQGYSTSCPKNLSDAQCLAFLQEQSAAVANEKQNLSQQLSNEQYEQLSLLEKISYLDNQIAAKEKTIDELEIEIETRNVEVRILNSDINDLKNDIDTLKQEVNKLNNSIEKRVTLSYKYSFVTPVEIFLENSNFESLLRKLKYLSETRKKDKTLLGQMTEKSDLLQKQEDVLADKKSEVETKRAEIEEEKSEQFEIKEDMSKQRSTRASLYAESKRRERELQAKLDANRIAQSKLDAAVIEYIAKTAGKAVYGGRVAKGQAIGTMGNTGLSYGTHLHFSIGTKGYTPGYGNVNPWGGYLKKGPDYWTISGGWTYYYIHAASFGIPASGKVAITQDHHQGYAVDMISISTATNSPLGSGSAIIYATGAGKIYSGVDQYGGRYVWIDHDNGLRTTYLHLKDVYVLK